MWILYEPLCKMFSLLSVRRIKILFGNRAKRRDRTPNSLHDCLENAPQKKYNWLKIVIIIWLLGATIYFMFNNHTNNSVDPDNPYLEVFPEDELKTVTEKVSFTDVFTYEDDPHKIKKVLTNLEQSPMDTSTTGTTTKRQVIEPQRNLPLCISRIRTKNITIHMTKDNSIQTTLKMIVMGGYYRPKDCRSRHRVAIIVPYRDREDNLAVFLYNIHPFLIRQKVEYRIFVIEQYGYDLFNRGRLFNAGFLEVQKMGHWPCIIFHDVDLLPTDDRILYTCPSIPRHMCAIVKEKVHLPTYRTLFGGVTAMTATQYKTANGFSNMYWGWGGEDNDMFWRLKAAALGVTRYSKKIAQYTSLPHNATFENPYRFKILSTGLKRYKTDGLVDIQYSVVSTQMRRLYTHILVNINPLKNNIMKFLMSFNKSLEQ